MIIANGNKGDAPAGQPAPQQMAAQEAPQEAAQEAAQEAPQEAAQEAPQEAPIVVSADQLITALDENALSAANTYKGKRVTVTGTLSNIDSSGDYFSVRGDNEYSFVNVQAFIDDSHLDTVGAFAKEQEVTFTGKVTSVGEIMGYSIDVETIG